MLDIDARQLGELNDRRPLVHRRQKGLAGHGIGDPGEQQADRGYPGNGPAVGKGPVERPRVTRRHEAHQARFAVAVLLLQDEIGEHRHQRQRQDQRRKQREHDGQRDGREQLALQPLEREQRQEHERDDKQPRGDRHRDFGRRDEHRMQLAHPAMPGIGQALDDIFDDDHGAVDQYADRDGKAAEAHQIGGQSDRPHEDEGQQRRHWQGECDDDRRADIAQKQQ